MAGINGVPPVYAVPTGTTLLETLLANWKVCGDIGEPSWISGRTDRDFEADVPLLTGLTLVPRRVFLHEPIVGRGACTNCSARELPLIFKCEYQTAGKKESERWNDPHVVYLEGKTRKTLRAPDLTAAGRFRMDRPWPDLVARLLETRKSAALLVVGFATNKAKNVDVWERTIELPGWTAALEAGLGRVKKWHSEGRVLEDRLRKILRGTRKARKEDARVGTATVACLRPHVEATVSERIGDVMEGGDGAGDRAAGQYAPMMAAVAESLSPGYITAALARRREIASLGPDMGAQMKARRGKRGKT